MGGRRGSGAGGRRGEEADSGVVVSFFGDGAVAQGAFHEAANLAALWRLPIVFFCENNGYAEFSPIADQHPVPMSARAAGYGLDYVAVDGNDVEAVAAVMTDAVRRIRAGGGPVFVEAATYRWHGHYEGDPEKYRSADELVGVAAARPAGHHPGAAARPRRRAGRPWTRSRRRCGPGSTPPSTPPGRRRRRT